MDPFLRSSYPPPADTAASNNDENPTEVVSSYSSLSSQDLAVIGGAAGDHDIRYAYNDINNYIRILILKIIFVSKEVIIIIIIITDLL